MTHEITEGKWKDGESIEGYIISDEPWNGIEDAEDEQIFFYFASPEEMNAFIEKCKAGEDAGEDFIITEINGKI